MILARFVGKFNGRCRDLSEGDCRIKQACCARQSSVCGWHERGVDDVQFPGNERASAYSRSLVLVPCAGDHFFNYFGAGHGKTGWLELFANNESPVASWREMAVPGIVYIYRLPWLQSGGRRRSQRLVRGARDRCVRKLG